MTTIMWVDLMRKFSKDMVDGCLNVKIEAGGLHVFSNEDTIDKHVINKQFSEIHKFEYRSHKKNKLNKHSINTLSTRQHCKYLKDCWV